MISDGKDAVSTFLPPQSEPDTVGDGTEETAFLIGLRLCETSDEMEGDEENEEDQFRLRTSMAIYSPSASPRLTSLIPTTIGVETAIPVIDLVTDDMSATI